MSAVKDNVIRLYDVKPEMALEHLKRSTGLDFDDMPQNLVMTTHKQSSFGMTDMDDSEFKCAPPILTDIVAAPVCQK